MKVVTAPVVLALRIAWWLVVWRLAATLFCRTFTVDGAETLPGRPVVFAPNHSSHADTALLQLALAQSGTYRVLTAGAEDYFFAKRALGWWATFVGVYRFPRAGEQGVLRTRALLGAGWSTIVYPQGTRSGGPFRRGIARIVSRDFAVVPVTILGTDRLLPKGRRWPRRADVAIRFGPQITVEIDEDAAVFAQRVEAAVFDNYGTEVAA